MAPSRFRRDRARDVTPFRDTAPNSATNAVNVQGQPGNQPNRPTTPGPTSQPNRPTTPGPANKPKRPTTPGPANQPNRPTTPGPNNQPNRPTTPGPTNQPDIASSDSRSTTPSPVSRPITPGPTSPVCVTPSPENNPIWNSYDAPINFTWVIPEELCGMGWPKSRDQVRFLITQGIDHLVTLSPEKIPPVYAFPDLKHTSIPVEDFTGPTIAEIQKFIEIMDEARKDGEAVGVHCAEGRGRTGVMCACYLIYYHDMEPWDAIRIMRRQRPGSVERKIQEETVIKFWTLVQDYGKSSLDKLEEREKQLIEQQRRQQSELHRESDITSQQMTMNLLGHMNSFYKQSSKVKAERSQRMRRAKSMTKIEDEEEKSIAQLKNHLASFFTGSGREARQKRSKSQARDIKDLNSDGEAERRSRATTPGKGLLEEVKLKPVGESKPKNRLEPPAATEEPCEYKNHFRDFMRTPAINPRTPSTVKRGRSFSQPRDKDKDSGKEESLSRKESFEDKYVADRNEQENPLEKYSKSSMLVRERINLRAVHLPKWHPTKRQSLKALRTDGDEVDSDPECSFLIPWPGTPKAKRKSTTLPEVKITEVSPPREIQKERAIPLSIAEKEDIDDLLADLKEIVKPENINLQNKGDIKPDLKVGSSLEKLSAKEVLKEKDIPGSDAENGNIDGQNIDQQATVKLEDSGTAKLESKNDITSKLKVEFASETITDETPNLETENLPVLPKPQECQVIRDLSESIVVGLQTVWFQEEGNFASNLIDDILYQPNLLIHVSKALNVVSQISWYQEGPPAETSEDIDNIVLCQVDVAFRMFEAVEIFSEISWSQVSMDCMVITISELALCQATVKVKQSKCVYVLVQDSLDQIDYLEILMDISDVAPIAKDVIINELSDQSYEELSIVVKKHPKLQRTMKKIKPAAIKKKLNPVVQDLGANIQLGIRPDLQSDLPAFALSQLDSQVDLSKSSIHDNVQVGKIKDQSEQEFSNLNKENEEEQVKECPALVYGNEEQKEQIQECPTLVSSQEGQIKDYPAVVYSQDEQQSECLSPIYNQEKQIQEYAAPVSNQEEQIQEWPALASSQEEQIQECSALVFRKEEQVQESSVLVPSQEEQKQECPSLVSSQEEQIQEWPALVSSQEEQIQECSALVFRKAEQVQESSVLVPSQEEQKQECPSLVSSQEEQIQEWSALVSSQEIQIQEWSALASSQEEQIQECLALISNEKEQILECSALVSNHEEKIQEYPALVSGKEVQIRECPALVSSKNEQIQECPALVSNKEEQIQEYTTLISVKEKQIQECPSLLSSKEEQIQEGPALVPIQEECPELLSSKEEQIQECPVLLSRQEEKVQEYPALLTSREEQIQELSICEPYQEHIQDNPVNVLSHGEQMQSCSIFISNSKGKVEKHPVHLSSLCKVIQESIVFIPSQESSLSVLPINTSNQEDIIQILPVTEKLSRKLDVVMNVIKLPIEKCILTNGMPDVQSETDTKSSAIQKLEHNTDAITNKTQNKTDTNIKTNAMEDLGVIEASKAISTPILSVQKYPVLITKRKDIPKLPAVTSTQVLPTPASHVYASHQKERILEPPAQESYQIYKDQELPASFSKKVLKQITENQSNGMLPVESKDIVETNVFNDTAVDYELELFLNWRVSSDELETLPKMNAIKSKAIVKTATASVNDQNISQEITENINRIKRGDVSLESKVLSKVAEHSELTLSMGSSVQPQVVHELTSLKQDHPFNINMLTSTMKTIPLKKDVVIDTMQASQSKEHVLIQSTKEISPKLEMHSNVMKEVNTDTLKQIPQEFPQTENIIVQPSQKSAPIIINQCSLIIDTSGEVSPRSDIQISEIDLQNNEHEKVFPKVEFENLHTKTCTILTNGIQDVQSKIHTDVTTMSTIITNGTQNKSYGDISTNGMEDLPTQTSLITNTAENVLQRNNINKKEVFLLEKDHEAAAVAHYTLEVAQTVHCTVVTKNNAITDTEDNIKSTTDTSSINVRNIPNNQHKGGSFCLPWPATPGTVKKKFVTNDKSAISITPGTPRRKSSGNTATQSEKTPLTNRKESSGVLNRISNNSSFVLTNGEEDSNTPTMPKTPLENRRKSTGVLNRISNSSLAKIVGNEEVKSPQQTPMTTRKKSNGVLSRISSSSLFLNITSKESTTPQPPPRMAKKSNGALTKMTNGNNLLTSSKHRSASITPTVGPADCSDNCSGISHRQQRKETRI